MCLLVAFRFPPTQQPLLEIPLPGWFYFPCKRSVIPRGWGWGGGCFWGAELRDVVWCTSTFVYRHQRWCHPGAGLAGYLPLRGGHGGSGRGHDVISLSSSYTRRWCRRSFACLGSLLSSSSGKETAPTCWKAENSPVSLLFALAELAGNSSSIWLAIFL